MKNTISQLRSMSGEERIIRRHCPDIRCRNAKVCKGYRLLARELAYEWTLIQGYEDNCAGMPPDPEDELFLDTEWQIYLNRLRHVATTVEESLFASVLVNANGLLVADRQRPAGPPFGTTDGRPFCETQRKTAIRVVRDKARQLTEAGIDWRQYWTPENNPGLISGESSDDYLRLQFTPECLSDEQRDRDLRARRRPPLRDLGNLPRLPRGHAHTE